MRPRIDWGPAKPGSPEAVVDFLGRLHADLATDHRWLSTEAAVRDADDPAFVQCLRLCLKERRYHAGLIQRLAQRLDCPLPASGSALSDRYVRRGRQLLGVRFELAMLLLTQIVNLELCELARENVDDAPTRETLDQIIRDARSHLAFYRERLTREFADFNFVRRNLRRYRLRGLFAGTLAIIACRQRRLIHAAGQSEGQFIRRAWSRFAEMLEQMVPYRRAQLLATLLSQRDEPYAKPHLPTQP